MAITRLGCPWMRPRAYLQLSPLRLLSISPNKHDSLLEPAPGSTSMIGPVLTSGDIP